MLRSAAASAQPGVDGILAGHTQHWQLPVLAVLMAWEESCGEMAASAAVEALGGFMKKIKKPQKRAGGFSHRSLCKYE